MKFNRTIFTFLFMLTSITSCKKLGMVKQGEIEILARPAYVFDQISLYNNINLILTQDTIEKIKVEAGTGIQPFITTTITDNILEIKNTSDGLLNNPNELINVYVSFKNLNKINYQGSGDINCLNTIKSNYFTIISNNGAGNVHLYLDVFQTIAGIYNENADFIFEGYSDTCYTYCSSRASINFKNFSVKKLHIDYSSIRDAYISVSERLHGKIFYKGNIFFSGKPGIIDVHSDNEGRFIPY